MAVSANKNFRQYLLLLLLIAAGGYAAVAAMGVSASEAQGATSAGVGEKDFYDAELLARFYGDRTQKPVWLRGISDFQPRVSAVLNLLEASWTHGLNPENYHAQELRRMMSDPAGMNRNEFDMLLSDAVIRYTRDLTGMRGLKTADEKSARYWREPMEAEAILEKVALSSDPVASLHRLAPTGNLYQALREELVSLAEEPDPKNNPIKIGSVLKPGQKSAAVPKLRQRFELEADKSTIYDDALAAKIMTFQRRNGIEANGVIRPDTVSALNRSRESRMMQIMANMERLRWMEQGRPDRYVLVNIPSASLWAVEEGRVVLEMPVIVGKTARPTYSFKTDISGVRFNPNWTVPPTIKNADFLPALQGGSQMLLERGIRILYQGREVDPTKVDWSKVTPKDLAEVKMIQAPGEENPLGKVRVIMENPYNIYLHDTNHREMFKNGDRNLSSGCIRVSEPEKLADFILSKNKNWSWNGMRKMIESGKMRDVLTEQKLPVYITYQTIWLDSDGQLIYGPDVYGQDARLGEILKKSGGIHIPEPGSKPQISL